MKAKKHFGQHFLVSSDVAGRIVNALQVEPEQAVLEIGPGKGILTAHLRERFSQLKVVEIDTEAAALIRNRWSNLQLIDADFLKLDLRQHFDEQFAIIGNFPYNISSQIVFKILDHHDQITDWVGMFQLEMGQRLLSGPGSKQYGILSVLLPFYYELEKVMTLKPGAFDPPPKVNSIVLSAKRVDHQWRCSATTLKNVVKMAFNQRRKQLVNSLKGIIPKDQLIQTHFANLRPENLSPQDFEELSVFIESNVDR